jgi:hypothetical protein
VLSQAYIRASENAIDGISQKRSKLRDEVAEAFKLLKSQQEALPLAEVNQKSYSIHLKGDGLSDRDSVNEVTVHIQILSSLRSGQSSFCLL